ncbi:MAG: hypothetical protein ACXWQQ_11350 [Pseudobdellovibrio sp.]
MSSDNKNRRRTLLIYKPIQIELFKVVFWSNLFTSFVILLTGFLFLHTLEQFSTEIAELSYLTEVTRAITNYSWIYFIYVATGFLIVISLVFYSWLKTSNAIAGPLYNIKKSLDLYVETGEFKPIKLRENDKLTELAGLINSAIIRAESQKKIQAD